MQAGLRAGLSNLTRAYPFESCTLRYHVELSQADRSAMREIGIFEKLCHDALSCTISHSVLHNILLYYTWYMCTRDCYYWQRVFLLR